MSVTGFVGMTIAVAVASVVAAGCGGRSDSEVLGPPPPEHTVETLLEYAEPLQELGMTCVEDGFLTGSILCSVESNRMFDSTLVGTGLVVETGVTRPVDARKNYCLPDEDVDDPVDLWRGHFVLVGANWLATPFFAKQRDAQRVADALGGNVQPFEEWCTGLPKEASTS